MKKIIFVLVCVITFAGGAVAAELEDFSASTKISTDGPSRISLSFSVESFSGDIKIPVPYEISRLSYDSNFGKFSCVSMAEIYGTDIICTLPAGVSGSFKVEFDVYDLVKASEGKFFFKQEISIPLDSKKFSFKAALPEGMGIASDGTFPKDADTSSDGRNIFLVWKRGKINFGEIFSGQVVFEPLSNDSGGPSGFLIAGAVGVPLALAAGFFYFRFYKKQSLTPNIVLPILKEDEKKVVEGLVRHGSGANQKLIVAESGYSKAKVSKVIKSLAERGIVRFERQGRSNKIYWSEEFKKKVEGK